MEQFTNIPRDRARLLSVTTKEAGVWLNALPSTTLGIRLDNDSLRIAVALRLGAAICSPHVCQCGQEVDTFGLHGLSCQRSSGRRSRHEALNEIIRRALVSAGVPSILEPPGTSRDDGKRPDGMSLIPWKEGKSLVWDATCVDTLATSHVPITSVEAGAAAKRAEYRKLNKYQSLATNFIFVAFGVETLGAWGPAAKSLVKEIGLRLGDKTEEIRSGQFLQQRISIAIQRGNAASIMATLPASRALDEIYFLI